MLCPSRPFTAVPEGAVSLIFFFFLHFSNQIRYHTYVTKNDQTE